MPKPYRDQGVKNFHRAGLITKPMKFKEATYAYVLQGNNKPQSVLSHTAFGNHYPPPNLKVSSKESDYLWLKGCYIEEVCSSIVLSKLGNQMRLNDFLTKAVCRWGNVITLDPCTENRRCLEFAHLAIHTSLIEAIRGILKVKIDENLFHIQVIEEYPNLFSSGGSFDINGDFDMHHLPLQSNSNSYAEESINTSGKTQTRLSEMDDRRLGKEPPKIHNATGSTNMTIHLVKNKNDLSRDAEPNDLGVPVYTGGGYEPGNHND
ncbi:hypothetical protein Ancab_025645 [Ancistrocladus abbreviatus]